MKLLKFPERLLVTLIKNNLRNLEIYLLDQSYLKAEKLFRCNLLNNYFHENK